MAPPDAIVAASHLSKWYGRGRGIEDVTFTVPAGEIFGFLGPSTGATLPYRRN